MTKKRAKSKSLLFGRWHFVSMSTWDDDYLNEEVQAFIEFGEAQKGEFQFGLIRGVIDYREGLRDGERAVEWSWEGTEGADITPMTGRAWAKLNDDELRGMIFIAPSSSPISTIC